MCSRKERGPTQDENKYSVHLEDAKTDKPHLADSTIATKDEKRISSTKLAKSLRTRNVRRKPVVCVDKHLRRIRSV